MTYIMNRTSDKVEVGHLVSAERLHRVLNSDNVHAILHVGVLNAALYGQSPRPQWFYTIVVDK